MNFVFKNTFCIFNGKSAVIVDVDTVFLPAKQFHAEQFFKLAWMINKKPYIVPIPGSRKVERIRENLEAGNILLTADEVSQIDRQLDGIQTSGVFGGSPIKK